MKYLFTILLLNSIAYCQSTTIINNNGIKASTQKDSIGILLTNNTAATASIDSLATPPTVRSVYSWRTAPANNSRIIKFRTDVIGRPLGGTYGGLYRIMASADGAPYTNVFSILSSGMIPDNLNIQGHKIGAIGIGNLRFGNNALDSMGSVNATGQYNTGIGQSVLSKNKTGNSNIAMGQDVMSFSTHGSYNSGFGFQALRNTDSSDYNTAIGAYALWLNKSGSANTAIGTTSLRDNTTGDKNTAVGGGSMELNTTGSFNVGVGEDALLNNVDGFRNIGIGWNAKGGASAFHNILMGYGTGTSLTGGNDNIFIGGFATAWNSLQKTFSVNAIAIGSGAYTTKDSQMVLGNLANREVIINGIASGAGEKAVRYNPATGVVTYSDDACGSMRITSSCAPISSSASGTAGDIAFDNDYLYVCVSANNWKRVSLSTW